MLRPRAILLLVLAALAVPVAAWAKPADSSPKQNEGTLSIKRGKGKVDLKATGAVLGAVRKGKVKIKSLRSRRGRDAGESQVVVRIRGRGTVRRKADGTMVYKGRRIQIRIVDEKFRLQINGAGIHLSVRAQGTCTLQASPTAADPGVFSLNPPEDYQPLPEDATTYELSS